MARTKADTSKMPAVKVGDPATLCVGTDRYPYTVIKVSPSGKTIVIQRDDFQRTDNNGLSEIQNYTYTPNPEGGTITARWTKFGYCEGGQNGSPVHVGSKRAYLDPSF
jgi:hypothetical protein